MCWAPAEPIRWGAPSAMRTLMAAKRAVRRPFVPLRQPSCATGGQRGFDAGKKIKGRKRHIITDTIGHLVGAVVHHAGIQDRDGAPDVLKSVKSLYPWLRHGFADGGYAGPKLNGHLAKIGKWIIQIVKRSDTADGLFDRD
ncbi:hypothetical protein Acry_3112 (plasmid) [Acidiphilium cryptum JF-5]|uniref:Transposase IS4-like domain-containing protein n=1 Tax=Acidiphilium cryptum (strain JF-5) TaxID=349163 RepID=A5FT09_ACICJ|nr:hypothetical protein Acry_3112 [Acidiphilium cryptum JF-5]